MPASDVTSGRRWTAALVLGAALAVLAGVSGVSSRDPAASTAPASRILAEPRELQHEGDFVHPAGFGMPERVGPFTRVGLLQFDDLGENVSAGYNAALGEGTRLPIVATLYVYPRWPGRQLDAAFDSVLAAIGADHGGALPEFRKNVTLGRGFDARYAGFGYAEPWAGLKQDVPLRSYALLYAWEGWWVKWRVTTPAPIDNARMRAIVDLTESLRPPQDEEDRAWLR